MTRRAVHGQIGSGGQDLPDHAVAPPLLCLRLRGIAQPIVMPDDAGLIDALSLCIQDWPARLEPFDPMAEMPLPPLCVIEPRGVGRYCAHSCYLEQPLDNLPLATAVCAVLADVSQAYSEAPGEHVFGLHCGCVTIGQRTLVLAGERRAGKSTLVARLSAESGVEVLCDDVLPMTADGSAIALGLAPRLRLPLPLSASTVFRDHVARWLGPADDRYGYLAAPSLLPHGRRAAADIFLILDRRDAGPACLHHLPPDETLQHILKRSIAGPTGPDRSFAAAQALTVRLAGLRLVYSDLEEAVALLQMAFGGAEMPSEGPAAVRPAFENPPIATIGDGAASVGSETRFKRAPGVTVRRIGDAAFLWRPGEAMLWHLNPVARAIWTLMDRPSSAAALAAVLAEAFPDQDAGRLLEDVSTLLAQLSAEGLIAAKV